MDRFDLTTARLNAGLSQRELASQCDVGLATVQRLEDGFTAHPRNAKKVADFFEVAVTDLLPIEREVA
jgi:transcriptional regulator with XRE-family HTH domain